MAQEEERERDTYLQLDIPREAVRFIDRPEQLEGAMGVLLAAPAVGLDSEWRASHEAGGKKQNPVSILQLGTGTEVGLLPNPHYHCSGHGREEIPVPPPPSPPEAGISSPQPSPWPPTRLLRAACQWRRVGLPVVLARSSTLLHSVLSSACHTLSCRSFPHHPSPMALLHASPAIYAPWRHCVPAATSTAGRKLVCPFGLLTVQSNCPCGAGLPH